MKFKDVGTFSGAIRLELMRFSGAESSRLSQRMFQYYEISCTAEDIWYQL